MGGAESKPKQDLPPNDEPTPIPPAHIDPVPKAESSKESDDPKPGEPSTSTSMIGSSSNSKVEPLSPANGKPTLSPLSQIDDDPTSKLTEPVTQPTPVPMESGTISESIHDPAGDTVKYSDTLSVEPESKDGLGEEAKPRPSAIDGPTGPKDENDSDAKYPCHAVSDAAIVGTPNNPQSATPTLTHNPQVNGTGADELKDKEQAANSEEVKPATQVIPENSQAMQNDASPDDGMTVQIVDPDTDTMAPLKGIFIDESLPLLDLDQLWEDIAAITDEDDVQKKVTTLTKELKQYFWSHHTGKNQKQLLKLRNDKDIFGMSVDQRIAMAKALEDKKVDIDEEEEEREDQAGNRILFALRCDDKANVKKDVPDMTDEEDREFVRNIKTRLEGLHDHPHFATIVEWFALDMCIYIFSKGIYAAESGDTELHDICRALGKLFAEKASPKEVEMQLKVTVNKCPKSDWDSFCFHGMCDIAEMWTAVISRIPRKRSTFLLKFAHHQERMKEPLKNHRMAFYYDEWNSGGDPGGIKERFPDTMIAFFNRVLDMSDEQWDKTESIQKLAHKDGIPRKNKVIAQCKAAKEGMFRERKNVKDLSKPTMAKDPELSPEDQIADDWLMEKHYLLNYALKILQEIAYEITLPGVHKDSQYRHRTLERVDGLLGIIKRLGWNCTLRGLQLSRVHQFEEKVRPENDVFMEGLGPVIKFTKGTEYTALSHIGVAVYMMCSLRKPGGDEHDIMQFTLNGSGLEFLSPRQAFDETMPYIISLLSLSAPSAPLSAVYICNMIVDRIEGMFDINRTMNWRFGLIQSGRAVSVDGVCMHMCRYVERVPDQELEMRQFVYQSFQKVLRKIQSPALRYGIVTGLLQEVMRMELKAQLVTELKDVLAYGDSVIESEFWNEELNNGLKWRFLETMLPRFLAPRKDSLAVITIMLTVSNTLLFLSIRDKRQNIGCEHAIKRLAFMKEYCTIAKEVMRGVCACIETDLKKIPRKKLDADKKLKHNYDVQRKAMTDGLRVLTTVQRTLDIIDEDAPSPPPCAQSETPCGKC